MADWQKEWPTTPGRYLFYGKYRNSPSKPRFFVVEARMTGDGKLALTGDGKFLYRQEFMGVFRPFEETPPLDWENYFNR